MRVLFDIVHPADVLFFYHPIQRLKATGADVLILAREKDVTCDLLEEFELDFEVASRAGNGLVGLATELVTRNWAVYRSAKRFRPDVMVGFGGVSISHVGRLCSVPAIAFYDADTATLQTKITWPFIKALYVPESYAGEVPSRRTSRFKGCKELSYFHPNNFTVDAATARECGWDESAPNFFVRVVKWGANHDMGKKGWDDKILGQIVESLAAKGKVHISAERELPGTLERYRFRGSYRAVHHLLAKCDLYIGESATMAQEAAILGTPAIYDGQDFPGSTLEMITNGIVFRPSKERSLHDITDRILTEANSNFQNSRALYLRGTPDLANYVLDALELHARHG